MSFVRVAVGGGVLAIAALLGGVGSVGCSSAEAPSSEDVGTDENELRLSAPLYLGQIANGETKTSYYSSPPTYRAFGFSAKGGDQITADVKSVNGDAMGWITTSSFNVVASNDDASVSTLDSKVVYKVPAGTASRAYRIVFRDYDLSAATFHVKLTVTSTAPVTCSYDGATHAAGSSFPSSDGCNTCSCSSTGHVSCGTAACACNPEAEPWRNYVGTPTSCQVIRYTCSFGKRSFQNACGCGCENAS